MSDDPYAKARGIVPIESFETARISVLGAGSIGKPFVMGMLQFGIGTKDSGGWCLIDPDVVEASNSMVAGYDERHIGLPKVEALKIRMEEFNFAAKGRIVTFCRKLTRADIPLLVEKARFCHLMVLAFDDIELMLEISEACYSQCPIIHAHYREQGLTGTVVYSIPNQTQTIKNSLFNTDTMEREDGAKVLPTSAQHIQAQMVDVSISILSMGFCSNHINLIQLNRHAPHYIQEVRPGELSKRVGLPPYMTNAVFQIAREGPKSKEEKKRRNKK